MAIFGSFGHCLPNILHTHVCKMFGRHTTLSGDTTVNDRGHISRSLDCFTSNFSETVCDTAKVTIDYIIGNHTLAFDWSYFWWPWSRPTLEGHFSLGCHFHVHFSNPWHAFATHGLPATAELLVISANRRCGDVTHFATEEPTMRFFHSPDGTACCLACEHRKQRKSGPN